MEPSRLTCLNYLLICCFSNLTLTRSILFREKKNFSSFFWKKLASLNVSTFIEDFTNVFLTYTLIEALTISVLTSEPIPVLCIEIRPHAIPLTDAFK